MNVFSSRNMDGAFWRSSMQMAAVFYQWTYSWLENLNDPRWKVGWCGRSELFKSKLFSVSSIEDERYWLICSGDLRGLDFNLLLSVRSYVWTLSLSKKVLRMLWRLFDWIRVNVLWRLMLAPCRLITQLWMVFLKKLLRNNNRCEYIGDFFCSFTLCARASLTGICQVNNSSKKLFMSTQEQCILMFDLSYLLKASMINLIAFDFNGERYMAYGKSWGFV